MTPTRKLILFVGITLIVDTSAYAAITPLLPGLSEEHGLDKSGAGVLAGAYPAGTLLLSLPAAYLVSRVGPKLGVIAGLATLAASSAAFALAPTALALDLARFVQGGAAAAMWAGGLAWLVSVAPRHRRAEAIGAAIGAAVAGTMLGPVLGAAADAVGVGVVFGLYVFVPLVQIAWAWRLQGAPATVSLTSAAVRAALSDTSMRQAMWLMALPALAFGAVYVLVPLRLDVLGAGAPVIAGMFLAAFVLEAVMSPVAGRLADRRGRILPARIGLAGGGVAAAALVLPRSVGLIVLVVMVLAPLFGMLWTPAMALMTDGAEALGISPALGFGLANMAWGTGATLGSSAGGALAQATADAVPFLLLAGLAVLTAGRLRPARALQPA